MTLSDVVHELLDRFKQDVNDVMERNLDKEDPYWLALLLSPTFNFTPEGKQIIKKSLVVFTMPPPDFSRGLVFEINNRQKTMKLIQNNLGFSWLPPEDPKTILNNKCKG